jgi:hypothetical protein
MNRLDLNENGSPTSSHRPSGSAAGGAITPSAGDNFDPDMPSPPQDNSQVAAWYDTDL